MANEVQNKTEKEIPMGIKKFNWGAFLLSWIWLFWYKKWILGLIGLILTIFSSIFDNIIVDIIDLVYCIWIGTQGNKIAWEAKRYKSAEEFNKIQKKWVKITISVILICFIIGFIVGFIGGYINAHNRALSKRVFVMTKYTSDTHIKKYGSWRTNDLTNEGLAKSYSEIYRLGLINNNTMVDEKNITYSFTGNGICETRNDCYVVLSDKKMPKDIVKVALIKNQQGALEAHR